MTAAPTIGVEEEFLVLDPETRAPIPAAERVIGRAATSLGDLVSGEFARQQLEVKTPPCADAAQLHNELLRLRATAAAAARDEGVRLCAAGTPVIAAPGRLEIGDHPRYRSGLGQYRAMLDDFSVCAVHVHIHLPDRETAVLTCNHLRPWLPLLVALSANSPFHRGEDTGYAGWRCRDKKSVPVPGSPALRRITKALRGAGRRDGAVRGDAAPGHAILGHSASSIATHPGDQGDGRQCRR